MEEKSILSADEWQREVYKVRSDVRVGQRLTIIFTIAALASSVAMCLELAASRPFGVGIVLPLAALGLLMAVPLLVYVRKRIAIDREKYRQLMEQNPKGGTQ